MSHLIVFFCMAVLLTACGPSNSIHLLSVPPPDVSVLPKPNAPSVAVVEFVDAREQKSIGVRRDLSAFVTQDSPTNWISHALADQLTQHGLAVSYAQSFEHAKRANPDYIVSGKLKQVWLKELSATSLETKIEAEYHLASPAKRIVNENNKAAETRAGLPSHSAAEELLRNTMHDFVEAMANKIADIIWQKK